MKVDILGYRVEDCAVQECADGIFAALRSPQDARRCRWLACLNPHSYVVSLKDGCFARALRDADWLVPDGVGVVLASRILQSGIRNRLTGSDVFDALHHRMNAAGGMSVFFLGATEETLARIRDRMASDYPRIRVAGSYSPPFSATYAEAEKERMIESVNSAAPDVLWVGMTAPKQEKWIFDNRGRLDARFVGAVGAAFDFYAGRVRRPNGAFQRLGMEWLPRLLREPRRLWRRTFISAPVFLWHVFLARLRLRGNSEKGGLGAEKARWDRYE